MHDGLHQQALRVDRDMTLAASDFFACIIALLINPPPAFSAVVSVDVVEIAM
ncbi:hypothetical protein GOB85_14085 [Acetobacter sp. LMG 1636]|nr:hypothetical protein [Acetobacter fallax]